MEIKISDRYGMVLEDIQYEDELPEMTDAEYEVWFLNSWVDGVCVGYGVKELI